MGDHYFDGPMMIMRRPAMRRHMEAPNSMPI